MQMASKRGSHDCSDSATGGQPAMQLLFGLQGQGWDDRPANS
jgi:hypothetical protein